MKSKKRQWIVFVTKDPRVAWGIESINLRFLFGTVADAADDLAYEVRNGTTEESIRYMAERCKTLRAETGKTNYFSLGYPHSEFSMAAQRNVDETPAGRWYGLNLTEGKLTRATIAAFGKLLGLETPGAAIAALKATFVRYLPAAKEYVCCDPPAYLDKPVPTVAPTTETAAEGGVACT